MGEALPIDRGHVCAHASGVLHGGHPISSGVRYILVAFCTVDPAYMPWASRWFEHVKGIVDPGDEEEQPVYGL